MAFEARDEEAPFLVVWPGGVNCPVGEVGLPLPRVFDGPDVWGELSPAAALTPYATELTTSAVAVDRLAFVSRGTVKNKRTCEW